MKIVVIGGSGHIGSFLVPRLVRAGHEVNNVSRGHRKPYVDVPEWKDVRHVAADREQEDRSGTFGDLVAGLNADVVIDLVCFTLESAVGLVEKLRGATGHLLHCGSIWRCGPSRKVPIPEDADMPPIGEYGTRKDAIARMLKAETAGGGLATTSLHPGHIVGPGWQPIGPLGNLDPEVWYTLSAGHALKVPDGGTALMHHVHADDLAQAFQKAVEHRGAAAGEDFNIVAPSALSSRGFAEIAAGWFGREADLESITWDEFRASDTEGHAETSWQHLYRNHCFSIRKAESLIGYAPMYEPEEAIFESVQWLIDNEQLRVAGPLRAGK
ncbi:NAD-dependent epimerase/dehydratase family protein [Paenarthrobacter ureafaciens]